MTSLKHSVSGRDKFAKAVATERVTEHNIQTLYRVVCVFCKDEEFAGGASALAEYVNSKGWRVVRGVVVCGECFESLPNEEKIDSLTAADV